MAPKKAAKASAKAPKRKPAKVLAHLTKLDVSPSETEERTLNRKRTMFVREYLVDLNGRQAAIRAGYSPDTARAIACELLARDDVRAEVEKAMAARSARTDITADMVLQKWWAIANADPAELIEHRRVCCRYCYGKNNRYQRTPKEMSEALRDFERAKMKAEAEQMPFPAEFDPQGGTGYDPRKDPNPNCPECFGQGDEQVFPKDTRDLSPQARLLYAGVKKSDKGLEIKMQSQQAALENVAKHLGMFTVKIEHDVTDNLADRLKAARERAAGR